MPQLQSANFKKVTLRIVAPPTGRRWRTCPGTVSCISKIKEKLLFSFLWAGIFYSILLTYFLRFGIQNFANKILVKSGSRFRQFDWLRERAPPWNGDLWLDEKIFFREINKDSKKFIKKISSQNFIIKDTVTILKFLSILDHLLNRRFRWDNAHCVFSISLTDNYWVRI